MEQRLRGPVGRVVGLKQVTRALRDGRAERVYLCTDADEFLYRQVEALCAEKGVALTKLDDMKELGKLCGVDVKTATAALLK